MLISRIEGANRGNLTDFLIVYDCINRSLRDFTRTVRGDDIGNATLCHVLSFLIND